MSSIRETHGSNVHLFHRRLPPLHALTVFAAAAASGSFSRAGELLFVTQGAVSRQIQQLERYLGCAVFIRHKRGLKLTAEGQLLLPVVDDALGRLAGACDGLRTIGQVAPYNASKAGLIHLTHALAMEWARYQIRVNAICPGYIETEMNGDFWKTPGGQRLIDRIPQRRIGQPEHLDGALLLLASEAGAFMTGSVITVDGGHLVSSL